MLGAHDAVSGQLTLFIKDNRLTKPSHNGHNERDSATHRTDHFGQVNAVRYRIEPTKPEVRCRS